MRDRERRVFDDGRDVQGNTEKVRTILEGLGANSDVIDAFSTWEQLFDPSMLAFSLRGDKYLYQLQQPDNPLSWAWGAAALLKRDVDASAERGEAVELLTLQFVQDKFRSSVNAVSGGMGYGDLFVVADNILFAAEIMQRVTVPDAPLPQGA